MDTQTLIAQLLSDFADQISSFTDDEIKGLEIGSHELVIKVQKSKSSSQSISALTDQQILQITEEIQSVRSREEGLEVLKEHLKTKKELEALARYLDVLVLKQDKVDQIRDKIIEATIGAILRSEAIQGKKT
jgi:predicted  nucleic acid-binding Zn-ribbon protein